MLETADLILNSGNTSDWKDLYQNLWQHEAAFQYMFTKASPTEEAAQKRTAAYAEMHADVKTEFFVYAKATGQAIGIAGIKELSPGVYTVTDIAIGPDFAGRGFGKQILNALVSLAFQLGAKELHYDCFAQNEASKRLALSCGFAYSHSQIAPLKKNGADVTLDYYIRRK